MGKRNQIFPPRDFFSAFNRYRVKKKKNVPIFPFFFPFLKTRFCTHHSGTYKTVCRIGRCFWNRGCSAWCPCGPWCVRWPEWLTTDTTGGTFSPATLSAFCSASSSCWSTAVTSVSGVSTPMSSLSRRRRTPLTSPWRTARSAVSRNSASTASRSCSIPPSLISRKTVRWETSQPGIGRNK